MEGAVWILWSDLLGVIPDPIMRHARYLCIQATISGDMAGRMKCTTKSW